MAGHLVATYHSNDQDCVWTHEGRRLAGRLRPGTITLIAEGHDGHWTLGGEIEVSHVYLTRERLSDSAAQLGSASGAELLDRVGIEDPVAARILEILSNGPLLDEPGDHLLVDRSIDLLCLRLLRRHDTSTIAPRPGLGGLPSWRLRRVTDFMIQHLDRPIGLDELAAQVQLSRYHFCRAFRVATGRTPYGWLTEQRMARARRMLADHALSISEISLSVGYATPSAFSVSFRRVVGVTPSEYRQAL